MANNRDGKLEENNNGLNLLTDLPGNIMVGAMKEAITEKSFMEVATRLSRTSKGLHSLFKSPLGEQAIKKICQAIIDDDRQMVKKILDSRPDVLLIAPPKNFTIESKWTWQRFIAEKPAVMAAKRNQVAMLKIILPYYDKLLDAAKNEQETEAIKKAKAEAIAAWKNYPTQKNNWDKEEIIIPPQYSEYIKSLIDTFTQENFPNGSDQYGYGMLSEKTESALLELYNKLLPEKAVKLDDYVDVELLLLAAYKTFWKDSNNFRNNQMHFAFAIRVVGLILTALPPEKAKIYCEGIDYAQGFYKVRNALKTGKEPEIKLHARFHQLKNGMLFYRSSRDSKEGQGFSFFSGITLWGNYPRTLLYAYKSMKAIQLLILNSDNRFKELLARQPHSQQQETKRRRTSKRKR